MMHVLIWATVALGLGTIVVRRRSVAIALMATQSGLISVTAMGLLPGRSREFLAATVVLVLKTIVLAVLLGVAVKQTRETAPVRAGLDPLVRLASTLCVVVLVNLLLPTMPNISMTTQQGAVSLVCIGIAGIILRRATILQLIGILVAENGLALAALSISGGMPVVIELGAVFDVTIIVSVAVAFHHRIYALLGSGNSALLRELRD